MSVPHFDRELGTVGRREVRRSQLLLGEITVDEHDRIADVVAVEQLGREAVAPPVALALVGDEMDAHASPFVEGPILPEHRPVASPITDRPIPPLGPGSGVEVVDLAQTVTTKGEPQMSEPLVLAEVDGPILTVTINRPEKKNAANAEVLCRLYDAWVQLDTDPSLRVAILTGKGDTFCAGMDLAEIGRLREGVVDNEWLQRFKDQPEVILGGWRKTYRPT